LEGAADVAQVAGQTLFITKSDGLIDVVCTSRNKNPLRDWFSVTFHQNPTSTVFNLDAKGPEAFIPAIA
jgi:hypothetical protein